jgi:hypothetical protein
LRAPDLRRDLRISAFVEDACPNGFGLVGRKPGQQFAPIGERGYGLQRGVIEDDRFETQSFARGAVNPTGPKALREDVRRNTKEPRNSRTPLWIEVVPRLECPSEGLRRKISCDFGPPRSPQEVGDEPALMPRVEHGKRLAGARRASLTEQLRICHRLGLEALHSSTIAKFAPVCDEPIDDESTDGRSASRQAIAIPAL